ncbi:MAG TPA: hypothetical protein PLK04_11850, partial [Bacillota bacterium]|nr:hypothetical protein [Bacillota bacterium]HPZ14900.1 hypothetical protein [Bacillota bacterium]
MTSNEADHIRKLTEEAFWSAVHRRRKDNPHEVTAEQAGAALESALLGHLTDTNNPHRVTVKQ